MNWNTITVEQYQTVMQVIASDMDELDKEINVCALLTGKTPTDIEALSLEDYTNLKRRVSFVYGKPPEGKAKTAWKGYRFIYDIGKINAGRFISVNTFMAGGIVENLHNLAACIVKPIFGKYKAENHEKYAADMKQAPLVSILSSCVFFCQLFEKSVLALVDQVSGMEVTAENRQTLISLKSSLDGLFTRNDSPPITGLA
jgi:hypothetical protein